MSTDALQFTAFCVLAVLMVAILVVLRAVVALLRSKATDTPTGHERSEFRAYRAMVTAVFIGMFGTLGVVIATLFMQTGNTEKVFMILGTGGPLNAFAYMLYHSWNHIRKDNHEREMKELDRQIGGAASAGTLAGAEQPTAR